MSPSRSPTRKPRGRVQATPLAAPDWLIKWFQDVTDKIANVEAEQREYRVRAAQLAAEGKEDPRPFPIVLEEFDRYLAIDKLVNSVPSGIPLTVVIDAARRGGWRAAQFRAAVGEAIQMRHVVIERDWDGQQMVLPGPQAAVRWVPRDPETRSAAPDDQERRERSIGPN